MSMWEFAACVDIHNQMHSTKIEPPTEDEFDRAVERAEKVFGSETVH